MDGGLREVEGRIWGAGVAERVFEGFVGGEEGARRGDGDEEYGADSLVETAEEGGVEVGVAGEEGGGAQGRERDSWGGAGFGDGFVKSFVVGGLDAGF